MSQAYTYGGDTLQRVSFSGYSGQTFRPTHDHLLEWVDLELKLQDIRHIPSLNIYDADAFHEPFGNPISLRRGMVLSVEQNDVIQRVRFPMTPTLLLKDNYYCIVLRSLSVAPFNDPFWQYDKDDAQYPRGIRISSPDSGVTWTKHYDDDHMFVEFGMPPSPAPPPEPPIKYWATLDLQQTTTITGEILRLTTNVPTHCWMAWTESPPWTHKRARLRRGILLPVGHQYCFVNFHWIEQEELGDTLYHTFIVEPWTGCHTRWFVFRAEIDSIWGHSTSPIFKKHRRVVSPMTFSGTLSNRTIVKSHANWDNAHDAPLGTILTNYGAPWYLIQPGDALTATFWIQRGFLFFDTSWLPPSATIIAAELKLFCNTIYAEDLLYPYLYITEGVQSDPVIPANYGWQLPITDILGEARLDSFVPGSYGTIPFNALGLTHINPTGITKLCLRGQKDVEDKSSIFLYNNLLYFYSAQVGPVLEPKLVIYFQE